jgi:Fic family protein
MFVLTNDGKIEYVAAAPDIVNADMKNFYIDMDLLLKTELDFKEILFFASMLHLVFVKIHPFEDGNGRTARCWKNGSSQKSLAPKHGLYNLKNIITRSIKPIITTSGV